MSGYAAIGAELFAEAHPDADLAGCCYGEVLGGLEACTCWEPEYDVEQTPPQSPVSGDDFAVRRRRCGDCAYRRDSPENADPWTADELRAASVAGRFWCHDGMRRPARWRHPQRPEILDGSTADWRPPVVDGVPFRADGRPALLCAGWAAESRRQARLLEADLAAERRAAS